MIIEGPSPSEGVNRRKETALGEPVERGVVEAELRARRDHAESSSGRAVWCLLLGQPDEGLEAIRAELAAALEAQTRGEPRVALALLAGDRELAGNEARVALRGVDRYVSGYRDYVATMLALIAGDEKQAASHLASVEGFVATHDKLRSGHPASVADIPRGLVEREQRMVGAGIEALLAWHLRRARARSELFNSAQGMVCIDAIVALVLAHERELRVHVASKYRSVTLRLLAVHVLEWNGQPLPRGASLDVETDLVAGSWLQRLGVPLGEPPPGTERPRRPPRAPRRRTDAEHTIVLDSLRLRVQAGHGSPWQLASWALMLGAADGARAHLRAGAAAARERWWGEAHPNHNDVREHFAFALVLEDEDGLRETIPPLQAWMLSVEHAQRRYAHLYGCLDLVCDLLSADTTPSNRSDIGEVTGPLSSTRLACIGLVERDPALLTQGLEGMLDEHARSLERRSSPPSPLCEWAVYLAVAAQRLGLTTTVDERYAHHLVPIEIHNLPDYLGRVGRLPCDLLGRDLWARTPHRPAAAGPHR